MPSTDMQAMHKANQLLLFLAPRARPPRAQVVSLHCNLDKDTIHLMNEKRLKLMKPNAVLVNAARGAQAPGCTS